MDVTISIICRNEQHRIRHCIESIRRQDFTAGRHELLIIDNHSTDRTVEVIAEAVHDFPIAVRVMDNPTPGIAASRNMAIEQARFDHVLFIDADCVAPPGWLACYHAGWKDEYDGHAVVAAGGGNVAPVEGNTFQRSLGIMLNSVLGSRGSTQGVVYRGVRLIDHHPCLNVMFNRRAVLDAGEFDEQHCNFMGEDQDLSLRLNARGYRYLFLPGCAVYHELRSDGRKWASNMYQYGAGRVRLMRRHPRAGDWVFRSIRLFAPLVFASIASALFCALAGRPGTGWYAFSPVIAYLAVIAAVSAWLCVKARSIRYTPLVIRSFCITHLSYSLGMNRTVVDAVRQFICGARNCTRKQEVGRAVRLSATDSD